MRKGMRSLMIPVIMLLLTVLLSATALAGPPKTGCGQPGEAGHENDPHDWEFVEVNTVKIVVQVVWRCRKCGQEYWEIVADSMEDHKAKGNHMYLQNWKVTKKATCQEAGEESRTCTICGDVQKRATAKASHTPVTVAGKAATCTENGISDGTKCSVCGATVKAQETLPALGHNWKVETKEPDGLKDGEKISTCTRCGKKETVAIPAEEWFFRRVRNVPDKVGELRIKEQLKGSTVSDQNGNTLRLSVVAEGGAGPYTYEWFLVEDSSAASLNAVKEAYDRAGRTASSRLFDMTENLAQTFTRQGVIMHAAKRNPEDKIPAEYVPGIARVASGTLPSYVVSKDGEYFCRITDRLGNSTESAHLQSLIPLQITEQPKMINMKDKEEDWFICKVAGGEKPYQYQWWYETSDGKENYKIPGETKNTLSAGDRQGMHVYCVITDSEGASVQSDVVWSYSADRLVMYRVPDYVTLNVNMPTYELGFKLWSLGVPPYTYEMFWCDLDEYLDSYGMHPEDLLESVYVSDPTNETEFVYHVDKAGYYKCVVTDQYGQTSEDAIGIDWSDIHNLTITKQPQNGVLNGDGTYELKIEVDETSGKPPLFYTTYVSYNGETPHILAGPESGEGKYSIRVDAVGAYYFYVTDIDGNYAYSENAYVNRLMVPIYDNVTGVFEIKDKPFVPARLAAYMTGGIPPYHYDWRRYPDASAPTGGKRPNADYFVIPPATGLPDTNPLIVRAPGTYCLNVTDSNGIPAGWVGPLIVTYHGSTPLFTKQPENVKTSGFFGESAHAFAESMAVTGTGDKISYEWVTPNPRGKGYITVGVGRVLKTDDVTQTTTFGPLYCRATNVKTGDSNLSDGIFITITILNTDREKAIAELEELLRSYEKTIEKLRIILASSHNQRPERILSMIASYQEKIDELKARIEDLKKGGNP